jgi:hypothetical protein
MKKAGISFALFFAFLMIPLFVISIDASCQSGTKLLTSTAIPDSLNKIFQNSCMPCHGSTGGFMSTSKVNFSKWNEYSPVKQAEKAAKICSMLNDGKMPPKSARKARPEIIPPKEQINEICKWAEALSKK